MPHAGVGISYTPGFKIYERGQWIECLNSENLLAIGKGSILSFPHGAQATF
jgi:hypothetical protein